MADFKVGYTDGVLTPYSGDDARYSINDHNGVLTVFTGGDRFRFSPAAWLSVQDKATGYQVPEAEVKKKP